MVLNWKLFDHGSKNCATEGKSRKLTARVFQKLMGSGSIRLWQKYTERWHVYPKQIQLLLLTLGITIQKT